MNLAARQSGCFILNGIVFSVLFCNSSFLVFYRFADSVGTGLEQMKMAFVRHAERYHSEATFVFHQ